MWKCSVREKNQKKYTILNQWNQNNQNLNTVFSSHWDGRRLECRHWNKKLETSVLACLSEKISSICIFSVIFLVHVQDFIKNVYHREL